MSARPDTTDLLQALGAMADAEPGWYTSAQLLPTYNTWAATQGLPELEAKTLGEQIRREVTLERRRRGGSNVWHLTRRGLECRNWHTADD